MPDPSIDTSWEVVLDPYQAPDMQHPPPQNEGGVGGGGAGGGPGVLCGLNNPVADPGGCSLFYRTDNMGVWGWNGSAWISIIEGG